MKWLYICIENPVLMEFPYRLLDFVKNWDWVSVQSGDYMQNQPLTASFVQELLVARLESVDLEALKADVRPFLKNVNDIEFWSKEFFLDVFQKLQAEWIPALPTTHYPLTTNH